MDRVNDVIEAKNIALDYLSKDGIVVFSHEIMSIFRRKLVWFVEIESKVFTGIIIIKSDTGEVVTIVKL